MQSMVQIGGNKIKHCTYLNHNDKNVTKGDCGAEVLFKTRDVIDYGSGITTCVYISTI